MTIEPQIGVVLVELPASNYGAVPFPEKSYDSVTSGVIVSVHPKDPDSKAWIGKTGYWRLFKDDCRVKDDSGRKLALIEVKDIMGVSNAGKDSKPKS